MKNAEKRKATVDRVILNGEAEGCRLEKAESSDYGRRMMAYKVRLSANIR